MKNPITRRQALRKVATTSAGALAASRSAFPQQPDLRIAGRPVELAFTAVSSQTVRITAQAIENDAVQPIPSDGSLVKDSWGRPAARLRSLTGSRTLAKNECRQWPGRLTRGLATDHCPSLPMML